MASYDVGEFFRAAEMRDVLDSATCMANAIAHDGTHPGKWIQFCQRVFAEEGMTYRMDHSAEAHYVIDVAFQETAQSVIAALSRPPFAAAGSAINKAVAEITKAEPDGKHAIRDVFEGVETAFKVATGTNKELTVANIESLLGPVVDRRFGNADPIAQGAAHWIP